MNRFELSVPDCYLESSDFRFFLKWVSEALYKLKFDLDTFFDLYDPLRCPKELLWMLADTMGFKFDDRLPVAYNRLVLLYFMSMIRYKGSRNGVLLAANVNLTQFDVVDYQEQTQDDIDLDRLNFTNIRVNSAYVNVNSRAGYIDVVYYSAEKPIDACIEYVRPIGMYCFQHAGVVQNARTKLAIDVRLTDEEDMTLRNVTATQVGRYSREDYATMQNAGIAINTSVNLVNKNVHNWQVHNLPSLSPVWTYDSVANTTKLHIRKNSIPSGYSLVYTSFSTLSNTDYCLSFDFNWLKCETNDNPPVKVEDKIKVTITSGHKYLPGSNTNVVIAECELDSSVLALGTDYKVSLPFNSGANTTVYATFVVGGVEAEQYLGQTGTYEFLWGNMNCQAVPKTTITPTGVRELAYKRNSVYEGTPTQNAGYRSLYSLQLANNQNINNLLRLDPPIFSQGYFPQDYADASEIDIEVIQAQSYDGHLPEWNLLYDRVVEEDLSRDITTLDSSRTTNRTHPRPAVNPIMTQMGDAISMNDGNTEYINRTRKDPDAVEDSFPTNS